MASITWSIVFGLLILELVITFILVVPVPRRIRNFIARNIFRLRLGSDSVARGLLVVGFGLVLALMESYWSTQRLLDKLAIMEEQDMGGGPGGHGHGHGHHHDKQKLYRAERNMYLAGFALTLLFVIRRMLQLMQESVELEDELGFVKEELNANKPGSKGAETATKKNPVEKKKD